VIQENDIFDDDNGEDDLFGGVSDPTASKTHSAATSNQTSTFFSSGRSAGNVSTTTKDQESSRLQEAERVERFNALFDWLQKSTGMDIQRSRLMLPLTLKLPK
jgi:hypothetical protein